MFKKRIIPCLDIKNGRTVKGVNFLGLRDAGDPVELAKRYESEGADELVLLDVSATVDKKEQSLALVKNIAAALRIPFTIGGGIREINLVKALMDNGADKISLNTVAVENPEFIEAAASRFGSQAVVVAIDIKRIENEYRVVTRSGSNISDWRVQDFITEVENRGAGELLITSMAGDGTKNGFDLELYQSIASRLPIIASGGAGKPADFSELFHKTTVTGGLAASIFHFGEVEIGALKRELLKQNISIRLS